MPITTASTSDPPIPTTPAVEPAEWIISRSPWNTATPGTSGTIAAVVTATDGTWRFTAISIPMKLASSAPIALAAAGCRFRPTMNE